MAIAPVIKAVKGWDQLFSRSRQLIGHRQKIGPRRIANHNAVLLQFVQTPGKSGIDDAIQVPFQFVLSKFVLIIVVKRNYKDELVLQGKPNTTQCLAPLVPRAASAGSRSDAFLPASIRQTAHP